MMDSRPSMVAQQRGDQAKIVMRGPVSWLKAEAAIVLTTGFLKSSGGVMRSGLLQNTTQ